MDFLKEIREQEEREQEEWLNEAPQRRHDAVLSAVLRCDASELIELGATKEEILNLDPRSCLLEEQWAAIDALIEVGAIDLDEPDEFYAADFDDEDFEC